MCRNVSLLIIKSVMNNFVETHAPGYELIKELEKLSLSDYRISKEARKRVKRGAGRPKPLQKQLGAGRPFKTLMVCRFCKLGPMHEGRLHQHWEFSHHSEVKSRCKLPRRDGAYWCPVDRCEFEVKSCRFRLSRHLRDTEAHTPE